MRARRFRLQKQFIDWDMGRTGGWKPIKTKKAPGRSWLRAQFHIAISPVIDLHRKVNQNMECPRQDGASDLLNVSECHDAEGLLRKRNGCQDRELSFGLIAG